MAGVGLAGVGMAGVGLAGHASAGMGPANVREVTAEETGAADDAVGYLATLQFASGGFDAPDGFAGFLTADVAFALAEAGQSGESWNAPQALAAVQAVTTDGNDALDYLDDQADGLFGALSSGKAAQLVILAQAIGLDPATFDPQGDGATDLVAVMDAGAPSFGSIYTAPLGAIGNIALGRGVPDAVRDYIVDEQAADGSFGDSPDTTGLAIAALIGAGLDADDAAILDALGYLAASQAASGGFLSFGATSANSTGMAVLGIDAAGFDLATPCWRDTAAPNLAGSAYSSPIAYLLGLQVDSGAISDPADFDAGFATAQAVQGLLRRFVPPVRAAARECSAGETTTTSAPGEPETTVGTQASSSSATSDELPRTGSRPVPFGLTAIVLLFAGGGLAAFDRSRRARQL